MSDELAARRKPPSREVFCPSCGSALGHYGVPPKIVQSFPMMLGDDAPDSQIEAYLKRRGVNPSNSVYICGQCRMFVEVTAL